MSDQLCGGITIPWGDPGPDWIPCCMGSAVHGPDSCTCWKPVYDQDQAPANGGTATQTRSKMCLDCAYRPDSPERSDSYTDEQLMYPDPLRPFYCHQGMRRITRYEHPSGRVFDDCAAAYAPGVIVVEADPYDLQVALRADGSPADVCAGWAARIRHLDHLVDAELAEQAVAS